MSNHDVEFKARLGKLEVQVRALREYADSASDLAMRIAQEMEKIADDYENYISLKK